MLLRFTNTALLVLIILLVFTGTYGLVWNLKAWPLEIHRWSGWMLIALIPWKLLISYRSIRRGLQPNFDRGALIFISLGLATTSLFVVYLGIAWLWQIGPQVLWPGYSVMTLHWVLGVVLVVPLVVHVWRRWPRPKRRDYYSRRGLLRIGGLSLVGILAWQLDDPIAAVLQRPQPTKRLTGSRERSSFSGNAYPITTNPGHGRIRIDTETWLLRVSGQVRQTITLDYEDLQGFPQAEQTIPLDCTVGWFTVQRWRGVALPDVLALGDVTMAARFVQLISIEGYIKEISIEEANSALLCTHVGGEALSHQHGYPVRVVLPRRRGWFWVKWLEQIIVTDALHSRGDNAR